MFNKVLYKIDCNSVKIAREIEPQFRNTVTQGVPPIYTFKAKVGHRKPEALKLRARVAHIIWSTRSQKTLIMKGLKNVRD